MEGEADISHVGDHQYILNKFLVFGKVVKLWIMSLKEKYGTHFPKFICNRDVDM